MTETYGYDKTPTPPRDYDASKVPAEIKKRATWVKTKFTGEDVAEAYGQAMEITGIYSDEAKQIAQQTKVRQDNLETQTAQSVAQMEADKNTIVANATVDSEVILARGGKPTLQARLDETTAHLAQALNTMNTVLITEPPYNADPTGISDSTNAVLSALSDAKTIKIPKGVFLVDPNKLVLTDGMTILAEKNAVLKARINGTILLQVAGNDVEVSKDLVLDGDNKASIGVRVSPDSTNVSLKNTVKNIYNASGLSIGIWVAGDTRNIDIACIVDNVESEPNAIIGDPIGASRGIYVAPIGLEGVPDNIIIHDCIITNIKTREDGDGISVQGWNNQLVNVVIKNNYMNYCAKRHIKIMVAGVTIADNILINPYTESSPMARLIEAFGSNTMITGNSFIGGVAHGSISLGTDLWSITNVKITGNIMRLDSATSEYGNISSIHSVSDLEISNNTIINSVGAGIFIRGECINAIINNNMMRNNKHGVLTNKYLYENIENISINGNVIHSTGEAIWIRAGECYISGNSGQSSTYFVLVTTDGKAIVSGNKTDIFSALPEPSNFYEGTMITVKGQYSTSENKIYVCKNIGNSTYAWQEIVSAS